MKKKGFKKITSVVSAILCLVIAFGSVSFAIESDNDFLNVDSISICERHGIVEGESVQLTAALTPESAVSSAVKWYSSNPDVVSCTEKGLIKGVSAGGYADIYCEAVFDSAVDKIRVYCAEKVNYTVRSDLKGYLNFIYSEPSPLKPLTLHFNKFSLFSNLFSTFIIYIIPTIIGKTSVNGSLLASGKCEIRGKIGSYAYISFYSGETERDGFIRFTRFEDTSGLFLTLSATDMDVWGNGKAYDNKKLTTKYKGDVKWEVGNEKIISFDEETGQVIGLKPGVTTITATADGVSQTCTVHSLYHWPQTWTTQTNRNTNLYQAVGAEYKADKVMLEGKKFIVYGDEGGSEGWAYGNISGTNSWGYVPISHISVKGTVSQYRNLKTTLNEVRVPWIWPVRDTKDGVAQSSTATYVSSPYGWRDMEGKGSDMHKGIDITTGIPGQIKGYDVVSTCAGKVVYVGNDKSSGYGYCLSVRSDEKDPVTGLYYVVTYMHLNSPPIVERWEDVLAGQVLGYVGNTSSDPDMGYHLHFEVNCKNSTLNDGSGTRNSYDNLINPIFIFVDKCIIGTASDKKSGKIVIDKKSDAVSKYRGAYWYGDNTGKENNQ